MSVHKARAQLLLQQDRFELAEEELRQALAENPEDETSQALLAICLPDLSRFGEAVEAGQKAVGLSPEDPFCHYALAYAFFRRDEHAQAKRILFSTGKPFGEAEASVQEAIRLDPYQAHFFSLLSSIRLARRDWPGALEVAEQGLQIDPQDVECTNCRASALVKLGRRAEAGQTLDAALAEDPENSHTHANFGWALLHQGRPGEALKHFKEALRLDPANEWAQGGIVEALKARNVVYRWMLGYFLWMSRLSTGAQWGVVIGGYFLIRFLGASARTNPKLSPFVLPIQILYILFAILTWTAPHLFNLLLRLDKYGRHVLSRDQLVGANCVGACLACGLALLGAAVLFHSSLLIIAGLGCMGLMIPVGGTFNRQGRTRTVLGVYTLSLVALGLGAVLLALLQSPLAATLGGFFVIGLVLFGWVANAMATR
jgi:tetratricopeptide (TPR) repeat protein